MISKPRGHVWLLVLTLLVGACTEPGEILLEPDALAPAAYGDRGPYGVRLVQRVLRGRVDQPITTHVFMPELEAAMSPGPFPPVLQVQGGLVDVARYRWLAVHLASRGSVVLAPQHVGNLAFFDQGQVVDALHAARRLALDPRDPLSDVLSQDQGLTIGHSLGGVVATKAWLDEPVAMYGLVLLASLPDPGDDLSPRVDGRVLSIAGTNNGNTTSAGFIDAARTFHAPLSMAFVKGMNHYQFTDDATPSELAGDGVAEIDLASGRRLAMFLVDALLDEIKGQDSALWTASELWPEGLLSASEVVP
ncbi:MAG: alpha/beta hydrolase [Pseudomonadota bacterium]